MSGAQTTTAIGQAPPPGAPYDPAVGYTNYYNTPLTPQQEQAFQAWGAAQAESRPDHRNPAKDTYDYDMRGAWLHDAQAAANGHLPDTWKKPNEPTFSTQSQYSTPQTPGGVWAKSTDGTWSFTPSQFNLKMNSPADLQRLWPTKQPGAKLNLPQAAQTGLTGTAGLDALAIARGQGNAIQGMSNEAAQRLYAPPPVAPDQAAPTAAPQPAPQGVVRIMPRVNYQQSTAGVS